MLNENDAPANSQSYPINRNRSDNELIQLEEITSTRQFACWLIWINMLSVTAGVTRVWGSSAQYYHSKTRLVAFKTSGQRNVAENQPAAYKTGEFPELSMNMISWLINTWRELFKIEYITYYTEMFACFLSCDEKGEIKTGLFGKQSLP